MIRFSGHTTIAQNKHAVESAIILFAKCLHYFVPIFFKIERSVLIVLVLSFKGMLEKVSMQRTKQFSYFFVAEKNQLNAAHA